jgi:hypothetical protein
LWLRPAEKKHERGYLDGVAHHRCSDAIEWCRDRQRLREPEHPDKVTPLPLLLSCRRIYRELRPAQAVSEDQWLRCEELFEGLRTVRYVPDGVEMPLFSLMCDLRADLYLVARSLLAYVPERTYYMYSESSERPCPGLYLYVVSRSTPSFDNARSPHPWIQQVGVSIYKWTLKQINFKHMHGLRIYDDGSIDEIIPAT